MRMRQQYIIYHRRIHRKRYILIQVNTLLHSVINQNVLIPNLQIMTTSGYFMVSADKCDLHRKLCTTFLLF